MRRSFATALALLLGLVVSGGAQTAGGAATPIRGGLFEASGGSNVYENTDLQRLWRDANVASQHRGSTWDVQGLNYGRELVGLPPAWMEGISV